MIREQKNKYKILFKYMKRRKIFAFALKRIYGIDVKMCERIFAPYICLDYEIDAKIDLNQLRKMLQVPVKIRPHLLNEHVDLCDVNDFFFKNKLLRLRSRRAALHHINYFAS